MERPIILRRSSRGSSSGSSRSYHIVSRQRESDRINDSIRRDIPAEERIFACQICHANQVAMVLIPCMHCCLCETCSSHYKENYQTCPICRQEYYRIKRIYLSSS